MNKTQIAYLHLKRIMDIAASFILLIVFLPAFVFVPLIITCLYRTNPFFVQERIGLNGKIFKIIKFKTMRDGSEKFGVYSNDKDTRVTKFGLFLRKTSLDEIPQLLNIFKGDMSFVGPRPPLTYHPWKYEDYDDVQIKMFNVRPGLTGWAQINGRRTQEWNRRIELNIWYVNNVSFLLDIKIFFRTFILIFSKKSNQNIGKSLGSRHLNLLYITNNDLLAKCSIDAGVDYVFIDMEYLGKDERQKNVDSVKNHHTVEDVKRIRGCVPNGHLLVRVNPIHQNSNAEIKQVIKYGADVVMLPMFKTAKEAKSFIKMVNKKAKVCLLLETKEAVENLSEILNLKGIDIIHIGLNDLHLSYGMRHMFEPFATGLIESIVHKIRLKGIQFGIGGIARLGKGDISSKIVIAEHFRLGSSFAILSRSFFREKDFDVQKDETLFAKLVNEIRNYEDELNTKNKDFFEQNKEDMIKAIKTIIKS